MTITAKFAIEYIQFLDQNAKVVEPLPSFAEQASDLIPLYHNMVLTRILDAKAVNLQRMGKMGTYPSSLGQEAIATGIGYAMHADDIFCPYYRDQGTMLVRGVSLTEILGYWGGDERCNNYAAPQAAQDFPIAVPIASQFLHGAGAAFAIKLRHQQRAVVCSGGDGSTSKGDFYEALNFAGVKQLPMVFVINNNQWAISVPRKLQTAAQTLAQKAIAGGFDGIQVDGNDVIAVRETVSRAIDKAQRGDGPTLIEALTYRLCDHTTADDARRYCSEEEVKNAWEYDPIKRLRQYLTDQGVWSEAQETQLQQTCTATVDQAIVQYLNAPPQSPQDLFDYLYAKLPEELREQREMVR